jgi:hypothetical protein
MLDPRPRGHPEAPLESAAGYRVRVHTVPMSTNLESLGRSRTASRLTWLAGRLVVRVFTLAAMLMLVAGIVFVEGIKIDADRPRGLERISSSTPRFASRGGAPVTNGVSDADVAKAKASLSGPRGALCRAVGLCDGLTL